MIGWQACPAALAVLLSACSSGGGAAVGGSADESASTQQGSSSLWERAKGLVIADSKTIEMSASALIADAFIEEAHFRRFDSDQYTDFGISRGPDGDYRSLITWLELSNAKTRKTPPPKSGYLGVIFDAEHLGYSVPLVLAVSPRKAWEVHPFPGPQFNERRVAIYMEMLSVSAIYANEVFSLIAAELSGVSLQDPDQAKKRVLEVYAQIPASQLRDILQRATDAVQGNYDVDGAGSHNIHFTARAGDFVGDARGMTWTKAGGTWFGDGKINGQQVSFRVESTTSLQQRQSQSGTNSQNNDAKVNGTGNIGPK